MRFYLDENVAASVQSVLEAAGHEVYWTRDITGQGAADDVVAAVSEVGGATLISHDKDFKKIAPRIPDGHRARFRGLNMVRLICSKPRAAERIAVALPFIVFEESERISKNAKRSIIEVKTDLFSIWR